MAITKQTAKRSTGGRAPREELSRRAARISRARRGDVAQEGKDWKSHRWITFTGASMYPWVFQPDEESLPPVPFAEGSRFVPTNVEAWCRANPGVMLSSAQCDRWGLTVESEVEEDNYEEDESDDEDDDAQDDNEDETTSSSRGKSNDLVVISIKYDAQTNGYMGRGERGQWYPLIFRMLKICDDASENMRQLRKLDEWCFENPGLSKQLPVGWRSATAHDHKELTEIPIIYQSTKLNCVALSAANVITRCDPRTAELVSQCEDEFNNLRRFAAWFDRVTLWGTRDVFRMLQDSSGTNPTPKAVMKFILSSTDGVYVVQPIDSDGNSSHAIGINCFNRTIHDSAEKFAMNLSSNSLTLSCGQGHCCVGFLAAYQLYMKPKGRRKIRRHKKW
jgi:hypothetical protein